jgi:diacylglycerol O-acyltransferase
MAAADAAWLHMEDPTNLMMITGLFFFRGKVDPERLLRTIEQRFLSYDRFQMKIVSPPMGMGRPRWQHDPEFKLEDHVTFSELEGQGTDEERILDLVSQLMSQPLDRSRALWHFQVVEGAAMGTALIARLHHAIADGIALTRVLLSLTDPGPDGGEHALQETSQRAGAALRVRPRKFIELARSYSDAAGDLGKLLLKDEPQSLFRGPLGIAKEAACTRPVALERVKAARQRAGCTVNDVLMAAVAGGLRKRMQSHGGDLPDGTSLRGVIPVDLRRPGHSKSLGNRFGLVFLGLPVGTACPHQRLAEVRQRMDALKSSPQAVVVLGLLKAAGSVPSEMLQMVVELFAKRATLVVSNVPGPRETLYLAGQAVESLMFWVPQSGRLGLGVSILSYGGNLRIGVAADAGLPTHARTLANDIEASLEELLEGV